MAAKKKTDADTGEDTDAKGGGKKKFIIIAAVAAVGIGGYVYGSGSAPAATAVTTTTLPPALALGPMVDMPAVNLNLADGHYLRVAVTLALAPDVGEEEAKAFNGAVAKDLTVSTLSGRKVEELATAKGRDDAKEELAKEIEAAYGEMIVGVFFTDFVTE
jgi:flagellar FliL protein